MDLGNVGKTISEINKSDKHNDIIKRFWESDYIGGALVNDSGDYSLPGFDSSQSENYEDPTFLGFSILFNTNEFGLPMDYDNLHEGLLLKPRFFLSAEEYLKNNRYTRESKMIKEFRNGLEKLQNNKPWVFSKISNLNNLYNFQTNSSSRTTNETSFNISITDNLNMEIAYLFDLYKKAVFDTKHMRWKLPDNLRFFSMRIYIFDVRIFRRLIKGDKLQDGVKEWQFPSNPAKSIAELKAGVTSSFNSLFDGDKDISKRIQNEASKMYNNSTYKWVDVTNLPILELNLSHCEFDIFQDNFNFTELTQSPSSEKFEHNIKIKVGKVKEINRFNGFRFIGEDDIAIAAQSILELNSMADMDILVHNKTENDLKESEKKTKVSWDGVFDRFEKELKGRAKSKLSTFLNSALLGNNMGYSENDLKILKEKIFGDRSGDLPKKNINGEIERGINIGYIGTND